MNQGILYLPVGNPSPDFYGAVREGDNLYTNSAVALDVRSGKLLWYRQFISNDVHDSDLSQVSPIFSGTVGGKSRKLMTVSGKDGLLHMLDRDTHETLYELPITTRANIDAQPTVEGAGAEPPPIKTTPSTPVAAREVRGCESVAAVHLPVISSESSARSTLNTRPS